MADRKIDLTARFRVILYLRMSSDLQNVRSPEQQKDTIISTINRSKLPWTVFADYRDSGKSGCYNRNRPGFQKMLGDIRSRKIKPDAILVDTYERFGRNEDLDQIRKELDRQYGVLILTADSGFQDPTTASGELFRTIENYRARDDNRIKAHNVMRGKRDAIRQKRWPGGKPPFGYCLKEHFAEKSGRTEVAYYTIIPDPATAQIIRKVFHLAADQGLGSTRIAQILNADEDIKECHKPFYEQTIIYWLNNTIYFGTLTWEKITTSVVNDRLVCKRNPDDARQVIEEFCEPLVSKDVWKRAQELRRPRSVRISNAKRRKDGKIIAPLAPGQALVYPLSGLVFCGKCNRSMAINTAMIYTTKSGEQKRYPCYKCPGCSSRVCTNKARISEPWLREIVGDLIIKIMINKSVA